MTDTTQETHFWEHVKWGHLTLPQYLVLRDEAVPKHADKEGQRASWQRGYTYRFQAFAVQPERDRLNPCMLTLHDPQNLR